MTFYWTTRHNKLKHTGPTDHNELLTVQPPVFTMPTEIKLCTNNQSQMTLDFKITRFKIRNQDYFSLLLTNHATENHNHTIILSNRRLGNTQLQICRHLNNLQYYAKTSSHECYSKICLPLLHLCPHVQNTPAQLELLSSQSHLHSVEEQRFHKHSFPVRARIEISAQLVTLPE